MPLMSYVKGTPMAVMRHRHATVPLIRIVRRNTVQTNPPDPSVKPPQLTQSLRRGAHHTPRSADRRATTHILPCRHAADADLTATAQSGRPGHVQLPIGPLGPSRWDDDVTGDARRAGRRPPSRAYSSSRGFRGTLPRKGGSRVSPCRKPKMPVPLHTEEPGSMRHTPHSLHSCSGRATLAKGGER